MNPSIACFCKSKKFFNIDGKKGACMLGSGNDGILSAVGHMGDYAQPATARSLLSDILVDAVRSSLLM